MVEVPEVIVHGAGVVPELVACAGARVDDHGTGRDLGRVQVGHHQLAGIQFAQIKHAPARQRFIEDSQIEPGFLGRRLVRRRVGDGLGLCEGAVLAHLLGERVRPDLAAALDDLRLVEAQQRAQHRQLHAPGDGAKVREGLGRDLADRLACNDGVGLDLAGDLSGRSVHEAFEDDLPEALLRALLQLEQRSLEIDDVDTGPQPVAPLVGQQLGHT